VLRHLITSPTLSKRSEGRCQLVPSEEGAFLVGRPHEGSLGGRTAGTLISELRILQSGRQPGNEDKSCTWWVGQVERQCADPGGSWRPCSEPELHFMRDQKALHKWPYQEALWPTGRRQVGWGPWGYNEETAGGEAASILKPRELNRAMSNGATSSEPWENFWYPAIARNKLLAHILLHFCLFEIQVSVAFAQAGLELLSSYLLFLSSWDYRCGPLHLGSHILFLTHCTLVQEPCSLTPQSFWLPLLVLCCPGPVHLQVRVLGV
jgi:hypothetical protein